MFFLTNQFGIMRSRLIIAFFFVVITGGTIIYLMGMQLSVSAPYITKDNIDCCNGDAPPNISISDNEHVNDVAEFTCCANRANVPNNSHDNLIVQVNDKTQFSSQSLWDSGLIPVSDRPTPNYNHRVELTDGRVIKFSELLDRPSVIAFLYSRCQNPQKCPAIGSQMGRLQQELIHSGVAERIRLILVSYDLKWERPELLAKFAVTHGFHIDDSALAVRLVDNTDLLRELRVKFAEQPSGVAIHDNYMVIADSHGRIARTFNTLLWDNRIVIDSLNTLLSE